MRYRTDKYHLTVAEVENLSTAVATLERIVSRLPARYGPYSEVGRAAPGVIIRIRRIEELVRQGGDELNIGDAANVLMVHPDTLRRWEVAGRITSRRTQGGWRRYRREDVEELAKKRLFTSL